MMASAFGVGSLAELYEIGWMPNCNRQHPDDDDEVYDVCRWFDTCVGGAVRKVKCGVITELGLGLFFLPTKISLFNQHHSK